MRSKKLNIDLLSDSLKKLDFIEFAYLFGSAKNGILKERADIDIAVYFSDKVKVDFDKINTVLKIVEKIEPGVNCDICRLNTASQLLRFEVLKGSQLFVKDRFINEFTDFYTRTCSEHEDHTFWMKRQLEYRGFKHEI